MTPRRDRSVVLLSGGMDSAVALAWAFVNHDVVAVMNFDYGQNGAAFEFGQACSLVHYLNAGSLRRFEPEPGAEENQIRIYKGEIPILSKSSLQEADLPAEYTDRLEKLDLPATFVPGRNFIFIALTTALVFNLDANAIVGGWTQVDNDYPDCTEGFLYAAGLAARLALGHPAVFYGDGPLQQNALVIRTPVLKKSKLEIVRMGEELGVPWNLTRSCYESELEPCLVCDSCVKRTNAFLEAEVRDPIVPDDLWNLAKELYDEDVVMGEV